MYEPALLGLNIPHNCTVQYLKTYHHQCYKKFSTNSKVQTAKKLNQEEEWCHIMSTLFFTVYIFE